jgi:hypothetical protein
MCCSWVKILLASIAMMVTLKSGHVRLNQKLKGCDDDVSGKPSGAATLATTHVGIGRNQTA